MNDGSAFPFIILGLAMLNATTSYELFGIWVLKDVLLSTVTALAVGIVMGRLFARIVRKQRFFSSEGPLLGDLLGLGLIGLVYGFCLLLEALGFLAVFVAAISLRQSELKLAGIHTPTQDADAAPDASAHTEGSLPQYSPQMSEGSLLFKEPLKRLSELMLVLLLGGMLFLESWSLRAVGLALSLFAVVRPVSVFLGLLGSGAPFRLQMLVGWIGGASCAAAAGWQPLSWP